MRLDKLLAQVASGDPGRQMRVQRAAELIEAARVTVDGAVVLDKSYQVIIGVERVELDGTPLSPPNIGAIVLEKLKNMVEKNFTPSWKN